MLQAALLGLATVAPLFLGAVLGVLRPLPARPLAIVLAFGAGTMIASVSIGLFAPASEELGGPAAGLALFAGTTTFVVGNRLISRKLGGGTRSDDGQDDSNSGRSASRGASAAGAAGKGVGWALLLGVLLDGVPENAALGVNDQVDIALLAAIAIGNAPEAIGGAEKMRKDAGLSSRTVLLIWGAVSVLLLVVVVLARAAGDSLSASGIAIVEAFAGGAVLAVLADSMIPESYEDGGPNVAFAVAAGFALAFALGG